MNQELQKKEIEAFYSLMKEWGIAMPHTEPLISDFELDDYDKAGLIEIWIANETEAGYCGKYLFVKDGQMCPSHHHKKKLETFFIIKGDVALTYDGKTTIMHPGDTKLVERGHSHAFVGKGPALILEVSQPCTDDDDFFDDERIPDGWDVVDIPKQ